jgi:hypothetical protein
MATPSTIGISGYVTRLTESLPKKFQGLLPSPEELDAELNREDNVRKSRGS